MDATERREQILVCATRLFEERPHHDVSTAEIAVAAGVARPLVHHYFGTKRTLYLEVLRRLYFIPPLSPAGLPSGSLEATVEVVLDRWLEGIWRHRNTWVATISVGGPGSDPDVAAIMREADEVVADRLIEAIGLSADPDVARLRALVVAFGGLAKASTRQWLVAGTLERSDVHRLLVAALLTIVRDVYPR
ncbi:unannotated protein [freshwater metagenome]|uniref:Unannotated protein n=1 Tax=freshwater metagenome TaxID=449393 RepID=A0A6J6Q4A0_9ZZZZ